MRRILAIFCLVPALLAAQTMPRPISLAWRRFDVDLSGPARPYGYVSAVGRRSLLLGTETGSFEAWAWPLKLLHDFQLAFKTPLYDEPINGRDIARTVEMSPAGFTIRYVHPAFTVRERVFAPLDLPAIVVVLEVDAVRPIEVIARFRPDLQYAWPAALGGQYVAWDDAQKAFVLSESRRQVNAYFGSPNATWATNNPSHMLADAPSELHIAVGGEQGLVVMPKPGEPAGRLTEIHDSGIPIVMAGGVIPRDSLRSLYGFILSHLDSLYQDRAAHAQVVLDSSMAVQSPDASLDLAVRWAELNLDEAMVCNPDLGCGLVAGYGPSGATSTRPGFGWFFGGDASINSIAMSSVGGGLWPVARDGLAFFARYQGTQAPNLGKIPHEISQGAKRIRWFEDYPYAFYHGDTTPFWILALSEYWQASGDTATIRRLWPNIRLAYTWAKSTDSDGDGLMDNAKAGAGAIEVGDLQLGLQSDIYMSAAWVKALEVLPQMAGALGDRRLAAEARGLHDRALATLREKFWLPDAGRYAFALLEGGKLSHEVTVWPATALALGLFDESRGQSAVASLAGAGITTDWGARALAPSSPLFDPLHYNNGTVWPFVTGFDALGLYRYHNATMGFAATTAVARTTFLWGLGANPEVFSGSDFEPLETAVPQQFFSTSMLLTPFVRGLLGWEADVPEARIALAPHLPASWDSLTVEHLPAGTGRYRILFRQNPESLLAVVTRTAGAGVDTLLYSPALPLGSRLMDVTVNGTRLANPSLRETGADVHVDLRLPLTEHVAILIRHTPGFSVLLDPPTPERGARSSALKLVSQRLAGDTLVVVVQGLAGRTYNVKVRTPSGITATDVAIPSPGDAVDGYATAEVRVTAVR